jgi:G3E family GTPase
MARSFACADNKGTRVQIYLICGFLGSGKTTLVLELGKRLAELGRPTCIIVNEVGEIGIDGKVLADGGLEVYELTAGCVCCQIGVDLVRTLEQVSSRYAPAVAIVEASGIAAPAGIIETLVYFRAVPFTTRCITLVDPIRLEMLLAVMEPLIESQIADADEIIITKVDAATAGELAARLAPARPVSEISVADPGTYASLIERLAAGKPEFA